MSTHLMSDEEFSKLLSLPLETYAMFPYGYDLLPSLSSSPSSHQGEAKITTPDAGISDFEAQLFGQGTRGGPPPLPVSYDTSMPLLADFPMDCMDFQETNPGLDLCSSQNATNNVFPVEQSTKAPSAMSAGSSDLSHTILNMVQAALDKMVASQKEHMERMTEKQTEQDKQLRVLSKKIDNIRAGLDSFSVDVWRWTRPTPEGGDEVYSSLSGYSTAYSSTNFERSHPLRQTFSTLYEVQQKHGPITLSDLVWGCIPTIAEELEAIYGRRHPYVARTWIDLAIFYNHANPEWWICPTNRREILVEMIAYPLRPHRFDFEDDPIDQTATVKPLVGKVPRTREPPHRRQQSFETPEAKARRLERQNAEQRIIIADLQAQVQKLQSQINQLRGDWQHDLHQATLRRSQNINNQLTAQDDALTEMMRAINSAFESYKSTFQHSRRASDEMEEEIQIYRDSGSCPTSRTSSDF
ncbi:hypothetical protein CT0861_13148 [Colletotrichum tofieldiae]|uniref:Uncharacterized protein n=1 Tax=Colletotrichum tofieldiae TaxID=708197 RepID=A0A166SPI8_9PEZI|nr:hypothetical protein CT0861_13148 [Colletotrichum tofieldiae]